MFERMGVDVGDEEDDLQRSSRSSEKKNKKNKVSSCSTERKRNGTLTGSGTVNVVGNGRLWSD